MKTRDQRQGGVSFWDLLILILAGVLVYLLYIRGHLDKYLPVQYQYAAAANAAPGGDDASSPPSAAGSPANSPIDLARVERRYWPKMISLQRAMEFPVIIEGKEVGSVKVPEGRMFPLLEIRGKEVVIKNGEARQTIAAGDTDVLLRVHQLMGRR